MALFSKIIRSALRVSAVLAATLAIYNLVAVACALFPISGRVQMAAPESAPLYVCADAVHSDFVVPLHDAGANWSSLFGDVASADKPANAYLSIGWGDLVFFTEIPDWGELRPRHVLSAITGGSPVALRVFAVREPKNMARCIRVNLDATGKAALVHYIKASLTKPDIRIAKVISPYEAYYAAEGRYSPFHTCNQWISNGLATAGLPHARFAPFSFGVTWPLLQ
jgi:uncharacterized protein (TIGR02117 family)